MAEKQNGLGPTTVEIDGETYAASVFEYEGTRYTVREISIDEGDDITDAMTGPDGKINQRAVNKMTLAKGIVEPPTTAEQVGKFPSRKYLTVLREFNKMNTLPLANPTPPAGSAGPTSPDGGAPTQAS